MAIAETRMVVRSSDSEKQAHRILTNRLTGFRKTSAPDSEKHSLSKTSIKTLKNVCIYGFQPQKTAKTEKAAIHTHGFEESVISLSSQTAAELTGVNAAYSHYAVNPSKQPENSQQAA